MDSHQAKDLVILFDLDGTLSDSDGIHLKVFQDFLAPHGFKVDEEFFMKNIHGGQNVDIFGRLFPQMTIEEINVMSEEKEELFRSIVRAGGALRPVPGAVEFLQWLEGQGIRRAFVTNAPRANAECMLEALDIARYGEALVIGDECARGKPHPDPYLEGARRVGAPMARCAVFEDSPSGARSGLAAGACALIGVCTTLTPTKMKEEIGASFTISNYSDDNGLREYILNLRQQIMQHHQGEEGGGGEETKNRTVEKQEVVMMDNDDVVVASAEAPVDVVAPPS
uniref:Riboflavin kinase n=1 Tax=Heterosigma akashiwo TaxID=2829 RepID=A0A6V1QDF9_HETAK|mmetsp:Transcript_6990/g.11267  ORF Transcript_6990/g.11267 Transcript_6990/m.11267 type:complete len:282 (+) Transcript_6990:28-873(+)